MLYFIKSELKKAFKRKYIRYYIIAILAASLLANLAMTGFRNIIYGMNDGTFAYNLIMFAKGFFWIPYYCTIFIADNVFGETYPDPRLRDRANIRLGRSGIYVGKLIASEILLVCFALIAAVTFLVITPIFQVHDGTINGAIILDFIESGLIAMPLFATGVSLAQMFLFAVVPRRRAFICFLIFVVILPRAILFLATDWVKFPPAVLLSKILITPQFQTLQFYATRDVPKAIWSSFFYILISTVIGCLAYRHRRKF
ncbi:MAG: hypothetical protein J6O55_04310 [Lachnospiraceae bacterium]|nr:hypothetical protein [Lachnospiraceae bacterium]